MAELSPMMKQYFEIKKNYEDTILMFRLGDFYEMFFEDAKIASSELELVLTGRDCGLEERAPMCGVPFHSVDTYLARLIAKGYKVAICEQMEDPAATKGIVRRDVVRIVTPGTVIESNMLDETKNNFLCSIFYRNSSCGLCFADVSTGAIHLTDIDGKTMQTKIINELGRFNPSEIILNREAVELKNVTAFISDKCSALTETFDEDYILLNEANNVICSQFSCNSPEEAAPGISTQAVMAAGTCIKYLREVQRCDLVNMKVLDYYSENGFMNLDFSTRRSLELTRTMRANDKKGSLLWVLDKTCTAMGKREITDWLERPLTNPAKIIGRHNAVEELMQDGMLCSDIAASLSGINDLERLITRISYGTANAKELRALSAAVHRLPLVKEKLASCRCALLSEIRADIDELYDVSSLIDAAIVEDPPFSVREGDMINDGFNAELDELRALVKDGKGYLAGIQQREQDRTGIKKLKIGYNRVFGYYIEVSNSFKELVPEDYIRKQTLANCERFITQELKELEAKVLGAQGRIVQLEYEIFSQVRSKTAAQLGRIQRTASAIARLDVLRSFAAVALENGYVRPQITADSKLEIVDGRHPVVEKMLSGVPFVPNDTLLDCGDNRCAIITGPNMAGKSTYMRQTAIIVIMAQIGSFVPARSAAVSVVDSVFTRVGASDDLSGGQSTFMVEMSEVAWILKNATSKSLIIFDEIGRGTSTYDGMSIARAVLEFAADKKKLGAKTLFATHYHELTELENSVEGVKNYNISVKKRGDDITFLRRIVRGCADGSYGIDVAKLAGVPDSVVKRARQVLRSLEESDPQTASPNVFASVIQDESETQLTFASSRGEEIIDELKILDVNTLTPIEAMSILYKYVQKAKEI
ncbi:MAG: DNA mismatch repair protein MutS [Clostridia bacterium]|nr:DNA mismatch repair protein MutS [Clostridia bacterium]